MRPSGFEPETWGSELGQMQRSVVIRMSGSGATLCPPMSAAVRSHLVLWLQQWLQIEELRDMGRLEIEVGGASAATIDLSDLDVD